MNKPLISLIAALSENRVIGNKGEIPWHIPGEQKRFKEITTGHPIIMGRKTFESIGRLLPNRSNIIITSDSSFHIDGGYVVHSLNEAINKGKELEGHSGAKQRGAIESIQADPINLAKQDLQDDGVSEIFIIGGGKVFEEAIHLADKLYLTIIHQTIEGDAFFPDYSAFTKVVYKADKEVGEYKFTYLDLKKS